ncbi:MAG: GTPase ObgE [Candidatus Pacebacteria bacterium]|nr:GTPase ObgE [Candidatus Paceibacterota bacterium]
MAFIDEIKINITSGDGGDGVVRWRQEKFKPKGGPGGGNGGRGGDVFAEAVSDLAYLSSYQYQKKFKAEKGDPGGDNSREGARGESLVLKFPVGSILTNQATGDVYTLTTLGEKVKIMRGGRGGLGNEHFKSSTNTTPYESTTGEPGDTADFHIELKLIADVGLVGLPSAGKSSLLNALTNAKSKVGDYHFTTLDPHLGKFHEFILADIPGLIEGASAGKGLGYKFLRHIQRTKLILHVVSCEYGDDMMKVYQQIRHELETYDPELAHKQEVIVLTKTDLVDVKTLTVKKKEFEKLGKQVCTLTLFDDEQIKDFSDRLAQILRS